LIYYGISCHFFFIIIKTAILAGVYASLILLIISLIKKESPFKLFKRTKKLWLFSYIGILVILFVYFFTYPGFHGLGDGPRIPIGYGFIVDNTNWDEYGYIEKIKTTDDQKLEMTKFRVQDDFLVGNLESGFYNYNNAFFFYDLKKEKITEFKTLSEYEQYATTNSLPKSSEFQTFHQNYTDHWGGWRFWLLP